MGLCAICNRHDELYPLSGEVRICEKCYERLQNSSQSWKGWMILDPNGVCNVCGDRFVVGWLLYEAYVCLKCLWKKLGKHSCVLKCDGERMW